MQQDAEEQAYAEARRLLRSLLLGIDPDRHFRLSPECVVMQPEVKVALAIGIEGLQRTQWTRCSTETAQAKRPDGTHTPDSLDRRFGVVQTSSAKKGPGRAGDGWSVREDNEVSRAFQRGQKLSEIARTQQRTKGAIAARLVRLGLVSSRQEVRRAG